MTLRPSGSSNLHVTWKKISDAPLVLWTNLGFEIRNSNRHRVAAYQVRLDHDVACWVALLKPDEKQRLEQACSRWAVRRIESLMRGDPPIEQSEAKNLIVQETDIPLLRELMAEKDCDYQISEGRDLLCSAAGKRRNTTVESFEALRAVAPTSLALCLKCDLPDSDYLCSYLHHPKVVGEDLVSGRFKRSLYGAVCDLDSPDLSKGAGCYPGKNACWERVVTTKKTATPAVPYSPRDLPVALDFLNEVWRRAFSGKRLLVMKSVESTIGLALPCSTPEEFKSRLTDLADLFKLMTIDDDQLPEEKKGSIKDDATFDRMTGALEYRLSRVRKNSVSK